MDSFYSLLTCLFVLGEGQTGLGSGPDTPCILLHYRLYFSTLALVGGGTSLRRAAFSITLVSHSVPWTPPPQEPLIALRQ